MQGAEAPVLQLAQEVTRTHTLRQVELALVIIIIIIIIITGYHHHYHHYHYLAVQTQDVLEYPRRPVEEKLDVFITYQ